jgi:uncharacterized protein YjiS (DUF1127 family)
MSAFDDRALRGRGPAGAAAEGAALAHRRPRFEYARVLLLIVMPVKAGIHGRTSRCDGMDSGFRRNEETQSGIVVRTIGLVGAVLRRVRAGHETRIGRRQLQSMSDWQLKDIGISRCDVERWAHVLPARPRRSGHAED